MTLGKQFQNTYWQLGPSTTKTYVDTGKVTPFYGTLENESESHVYEDKPLQGLLFDPHTGTGGRQDPTISKEHRYEASSKALNSTDPTVVNSLAKSDVPIQDIRNINVNAHLSRGLSGSGLYKPEDNEIHIDQNYTGVAPAVMTHELGHHLDPDIHLSNGARERFTKNPDWLSETRSPYYRADPVSEGKADAFRDRNSKFSHVYSHRLKDAVLSDMESPSIPAYGTEAEEWKGSDPEHHRTRQALYAASRLLSGKSNTAGSELANRSDVSQERTGSILLSDLSQHQQNSALLGHFVHTNPGLARTLHGIHPEIGQAAKSAHEYYNSLESNDSKRRAEAIKNARGEQLTLEGI